MRNQKIFELQNRLSVLTCLGFLAFGSTSLLTGGSGEDWGLRDADHYQLHLQEVENLEQWNRRKQEIRDKLLISTGLWPPPEKSPLNSRILKSASGDGFEVFRVHFESLPGFFATGNLYRPTKGKGPFPAVLSPHGHWQYGRLQNGESGSIPGRCIDFARQGFVVLSLDMIGYNDSFQLPHDGNKSRAQLKADRPLPYEPNRFRADFDFPRARLYGFNLAGMQLWNSIRALDFLCSLPEVDPERIGVTGASGGATQTILVMTADERVKVAAPVNIIGAQKHPGCRCENPPNLWIDISTVEMSAAFAPRPLLLMSATEDPWTHSTPQREYPLIRQFYGLFGAQQNLSNVHVTAGHNYNAETRAAVYKWFCQHLSPASTPIESPVPVSPELVSLGDLRVFPEKMLPEGAVSGWRLIRNWIKASEEAYQRLLPATADEFPTFREQFRRALRLVLSTPSVATQQIKNRQKSLQAHSDLDFRLIEIDRLDPTGRLELESVQNKQAASGNVLFIYPEDAGTLSDPDRTSLRQLRDSLLKRDLRLFRVRGYASGHERIPRKVWSSFSWPEAYNRSNQLLGIQDILLSLQFIAQAHPGEEITIVGLGSCGLQTAFAAALFGDANRVFVDLDGADPGFDDELLELMPVGAIKRVGDFRTAVLLLLQQEITLSNPGPTFESAWYEAQAEKLGFSRNLKFQDSPMPAL